MVAAGLRHRNRSSALISSTPTPTGTPTPIPLPTPAQTPTPTAIPAPAATPTATPLVPVSTHSLSVSGLPAPVPFAQAKQGAVELSWAPVAGAARYELQTWTSAAGWQQLSGANLTGTTFHHTGPTPGTTYYYWLRSVSASGDPGPWSERVSATVTEAQASAPNVDSHTDSHTDRNTDFNANTDSHTDCIAACSTHSDTYRNVNAANPYIDSYIDSCIDRYAHTKLGGIRVLCARPDCQSHSRCGRVALGRRGRRTAL